MLGQSGLPPVPVHARRHLTELPAPCSDRVETRMLEVTGEIDLATEASLTKALTALVDARPMATNLVVDLTGVRFFSAIGVGVVERFLSGAPENLSLWASAPVRRLLDICAVEAPLADAG